MTILFVASTLLITMPKGVESGQIWAFFFVTSEYKLVNKILMQLLKLNILNIVIPHVIEQTSIDQNDAHVGMDPTCYLFIAFIYVLIYVP